MAKKPTTAVTVLDGPTEQDLALTQAAGQAIRSFMAGVVAFFTEARRLEEGALATLDAAKALTFPASPERDAELQTFIKDANVARKEIEGHWAITSTVHGLHKRLVARRARGVDALEQAASLANTLHNRFVAAERQRVAEEQDRLRREAEARAAAERQLELQRMEEAALAAEATSDELSPREQTFLASYLRFGDAQRAAAAAGYKDPFRQGARLLTVAKIIKAIEGQRRATSLREQAAATREAPVEVEVEQVKPNLIRAAGAVERTTWGADVLDADALVAAVISGKHGIPHDVLMPNPVKVNEYGRSLHEQIDRWPGVRHRKTTKVV